MGYFGITVAYGVAVLSLASAVEAAPGKGGRPDRKSALAGEKSADPSPAFGPVPKWVKLEAAGTPDPKHKDDPVAFLLSNSQEYLTASGAENFVEYVLQAQNQAGLQGIGNVAIPWNIDRAALTVNSVDIERGGKTIDALKPADVSVIRRETKLEQSTLTGIRTVVMPVRGLQVGDKLTVRYTYKMRPLPLGKMEEMQDVLVPIPIARIVRRMAVAKDLKARWSVSPDLREIAVPESELGNERLFVVDRAEPAKERQFVPERFDHRIIQVSTYANWNEVAAPLTPLFDRARKTAAGSPVAALADRIAAEYKDPRSRMLAALRASQDDVRYVALLLGDGDYTPMTADDVLAQRYGDCKGKTALLLALLDRLQIAAEPVLASVGFDDGLDRRLPTLAMLDHVFVRALVGGETYYLDGTKFGQRTLEELRTATTRHVLPLVAQTTLMTVPDTPPKAPTIETSLVWDAREGILGKVPFEAVLTLRGAAAADMRATTANSSDRDKLIEQFKNKISGVANDAMEYASSEPEGADGSYVVRFKGKAALDWTAVEGRKGNRFQFSQSAVSWDVKFDRDDEAGKTIPILMAYPYWERATEKLLLPNNGKDFTVDAPAINQIAAATRISRTVAMADGAVTAVSDFNRQQRELDGAMAAAEKSKLDQIRETYAYVVSRKKLKLAD